MLLLLMTTAAPAQVNEISTLWREWTVLNRQLETARDEAERARKAAAKRRARRARRSAAPPSAPKVKP
jgi:outer membrane murein-binding lipoprotein Lpp